MRYYVRLVQGKGLASRLIEFKESDWVSHVELVECNDDDIPNLVLSSRYPGGVAYRRYNDYPVVRDLWFTPSSVQAEWAWRSMEKLIGRKYDWIDIFGIGLAKDWHTDERYICSEAVAWAFEDAGYPLFNTDEQVRRITPAHFLLTPLLSRYKVVR